MPPPRALRVLEATSDEPDAAEIAHAMHAYARAHQVDAMLQVLLTKLLETQPLDPFEFMITMLAQSHPELDALEQRARTARFDLRREKTKCVLVTGFYKRLLALQRAQHRGDRVEALGPELSRAFLLEQLKLRETTAHLQELFPTHQRDLTHWFLENAKRLPPVISLSDFTNHCMAILGSMAAA